MNNSKLSRQLSADVELRTDTDGPTRSSHVNVRVANG
jgi:hypothetical protein